MCYFLQADNYVYYFFTKRHKAQNVPNTCLYVSYRDPPAHYIEHIYVVKLGLDVAFCFLRFEQAFYTKANLKYWSHILTFWEYLTHISHDNVFYLLCVKYFGIAQITPFSHLENCKISALMGINERTYCTPWFIQNFVSASRVKNRRCPDSLWSSIVSIGCHSRI